MPVKVAYGTEAKRRSVNQEIKRRVVQSTVHAPHYSPRSPRQAPNFTILCHLEAARMTLRQNPDFVGKLAGIWTKGQECLKFDSQDYLKHIGEHVEEWTYSKFPYLKAIGWKGQVAGEDSGVYRVGPLGRLNASDGMATPLAQVEYQEMYKTLGGKPVHSTLAFHWARLIELLYATERTMELVKDPEITSTNVRNKPGEPGQGVGIVEAARGTLIHDYTLDKDALVKDVNLIVATTNNYPAICMSVRDAAKGLIHDGKVDQGILNKVEMAFRAYDPCFGCATHAAVGQMPLTVEVFNAQKQLVNSVSRQ